MSSAATNFIHCFCFLLQAPHHNHCCTTFVSKGLMQLMHSSCLPRSTLYTPSHWRRITHFRSASNFWLRAYRAEADPVVTTAWLADHLDEVTILDVRGHVDTITVEEGVEKSFYVADYDQYLEGHIPGAVFFNWTKDAIDTSSDVPVQMQMQPDLLAAAIEAKGVNHEKPVVAYDSGDGMFAARLWWMLTVAGHPSARVLEGGWNKWKAEGRQTEMYEPCTLKVYSYFEAQMQPQLRTTLQDLQQLLLPAGTAQQQHQQQKQMLLLDTRSAAQYTAQVRRGPRGGHIPGAVSLPRPALLTDYGAECLPLDEQKQILQQAGVIFPDSSSSNSADKQQQQQQQQRVLIYCNGGVAACTAALALHKLGHPNWAVYDGSWNEYSSTDLPVVS